MDPTAARRPRPRVTIAPRSAPWLERAVEEGGGTVVEPADAEAVVWTDQADPGPLGELLAAHRGIRWVQLPWAGVDAYRAILDHERTWTSAKGAYAPPVAEHALALLLAGFRALPRYARARRWSEQAGRNLYGAKVVVLGGGGIARDFIALLAPFRCHVTVVRRGATPVPGADVVVQQAELDDVLRGADAVVLALALLDENRGIIGADQLALLARGACLVNVARGEHVDTAAVVASLEARHLGSAGLDVTDPEPLPEDHPLWSRPEVIITPHTANTQEMARPLLGARITENVQRWAAGEQLAGVVDPVAGF